MTVKLLIPLGDLKPGKEYSGEHEAMLLNEGHAVPVDGELADYLHYAPEQDENTPGDTAEEPSVGSEGHLVVEKKLVEPEKKKSAPAKKAAAKKDPEAKR